MTLTKNNFHVTLQAGVNIICIKIERQVSFFYKKKTFGYFGLPLQVALVKSAEALEPN